MALLDLPAYSVAAPVMREAALKIRASVTSLTLVAPPTPAGAIACALIEGALIDAGVPYQRRLRDAVEAPAGPGILVGMDPVHRLQAVGQDPLLIRLDPLEADALRASGGDLRHGVLSPVAIAGALAESVAPDGAMTRLLRPWILAGNWLSEGLEHTYDPVYTVLRDHLSEAGAFRVVPMPEVPEIDPRGLPGIDPVAVEAIRDRWGRIDLEGRAQALSHLLKPLLVAERPSTARLEELGWHRILAAGWERDLASQLTDVTERWRQQPAEARRNAGELIDGLLKSGRWS